MFDTGLDFPGEWMLILSTPVVFYFGRTFYANAWKQAVHRSMNMDTLVALSTGIAYLFSVFNTFFPEFWLKRGLHPHVYFEAACVIIAFVLLGRLLEEKSKHHTATALKKLMDLRPEKVNIVDKEGKIFQIPLEKVVPGNILMVRPGEKIAVDGTVIEGNSFVDESMLSGEPVPVRKQKNDSVFAGAINQKGSFRFVASKVGADTLLSQIIKLVQEAQGSKPPVQKTVDKIAGIFVPVVAGIALLACMMWWMLGGSEGLTHGLLALITVLIIACPCALGLATPTAIVVGIGKAAGKGILIKNADSLEVACKIDTIVLDKTGTITEGKPAVTEIIWSDGATGKKSILANIEKQSEHPLAEAVVNYFRDSSPLPVTDFENISGKGVKACVMDCKYMVGSRQLLEENHLQIGEFFRHKAEEWNAQSQTTIWFADDKNVLALLAVADKIKESSALAVKQLQSSGIEVYMLTGDQYATAREIAAKVGISRFSASMLPQDKEAFVKQLQAEGKKVAMVGDGINDTAALARADLSIAMGKGSDIAIDVAEVTIISSDLAKIPETLKLSKQMITTIRQNLFWAFIYNLIGIPLAAGILYPINGFLLNPMIAGIAMALSSVSVVGNSLLLKIKK
jgi:Cu2+-exporting ATPase